MNVSIILVSAALLLAVLAACGGKEEEDDNSSVNTAAICEQSCATTASLACPRVGSCVADCEAFISLSKTMLPNCGPQIDALAQCASTRPVSDWECVSDGTAKPKASACPDEATAIFNCATG